MTIEDIVLGVGFLAILIVCIGWVYVIWKVKKDSEAPDDWDLRIQWDDENAEKESCPMHGGLCRLCSKQCGSDKGAD